MILSYSDKEKLLNHLTGFISANKQSKFRQIIEERTRHVTIILEDIYQSHNASAVLRTCDCFGIQDIHIIENMNKYEVNPDIALGSSKWIDLYRYNKSDDNTALCIELLKSNGYKIYATTPHKNDYTPESLPLDSKIALVFGTELAGLSDTAMGMADGFVRIPMYGFTESFNISVSAALILRTMVERLRLSPINWHLTDEEKMDVLLRWTKTVIKRADLIEKEFLKKISR